MVALKKRYVAARFTDLLVDNLVAKKKINPRPYLPELNERFIVLEEEKDLIKKISDGFVIQKESGKGIDILE